MLCAILWCIMGGLTVSILDVVWPIYDSDGRGMRAIGGGLAWPLTIGFLIAYASYRLGKWIVEHVYDHI